VPKETVVKGWKFDWSLYDEYSIIYDNIGTLVPPVSAL
jgi:hypothetical protein